MSKLLRLGTAALMVVATLVGMSPGTASAGSGASTVPFVSSPIVVGSTGTFSMVLRNENRNDVGNPFDFESAVNTVCNENPQASTNCSTAIEGITVTPSCGLTGADSTCALSDPGVFDIGTVADGVGGECDGMKFDVLALNDADGRYLFTPQGGQSVTLTGRDAECLIEFPYTVEKLPVNDADDTRNGMQTIAIADHTQSVAGTPNTASGRGQSFPITIEKATPILTTRASDNITLGFGELADTAFMSARVNPSDDSTISFRLYGPDDDDCSGTPVLEDLDNAYPETTNPQLTSDSYTPTAAGEYRWVATYSGDGNNNEVVGVCGEPDETTLVTAVTITTEASDDIVINGGTLVDTATVNDRIDAVAGATVTFDLYGPSDPTCSGAVIFTSTVPQPVADGPISSEPFTATVPGTYQWVARYSGDANNNAATGACGDLAEITEVSKAQPTITTEASPDGLLGVGLTDTATVAGRVLPAASTIDFRVYGPNDDDCSAEPVFESLGVALAADATTATSEVFTPVAPGVYRWVATYNGDANNEPAQGECGDPAETRSVLNASRIVTNASDDTFLGDGKTLSDLATVLDRVDPDATGTVDFRLYGPNDATCSGTPIFEDLAVAYPITGGAVTSGAFTPTQAGVYRWVASYSGDGNNSSAVGECGDPAETVTVAPTPDLGTELPETGPGDTGKLMATGLALLLSGLAMVGFSTRRRRPTLI